MLTRISIHYFFLPPTDPGFTTTTGQSNLRYHHTLPQRLTFTDHHTATYRNHCPPMFSSHDRSESRLVAWLSLGAATVLVGTGGYHLSQWVQEYGWEGALHYIWEGDPYPAERERLDKLDVLEKRLVLYEGRLVSWQATLDSVMATARLNTIDDASPRMIFAEWQQELGKRQAGKQQDLRTRLAILSSDLDKLAGQIDSVMSSGSPVLKQRKKALSQRIVQAMARADQMIDVYKKADQAMQENGHDS